MRQDPKVKKVWIKYLRRDPKIPSRDLEVSDSKLSRDRDLYRGLISEIRRDQKWVLAPMLKHPSKKFSDFKTGTENLVNLHHLSPLENLQHFIFGTNFVDFFEIFFCKLQNIFFLFNQIFVIFVFFLFSRQFFFIFRKINLSF